MRYVMRVIRSRLSMLIGLLRQGGSFPSRFLSLRRHSGPFLVRVCDIRPQLFDDGRFTPFDRHYVYHVAWALRVLRESSPREHLDIASSLHFVAAASAFVPTRFVDYRPANLVLDGLSTGAADVLRLDFSPDSIASLSCMHVIEHVGLGRYGDAFDPAGDRKAIAELKRVVAPGGTLLFVVPVSGKPRIEFNAHRVYSYQLVIELFEGFELIEYALIPDRAEEGGLIRHADPDLTARQRYGCGCFHFRKRLA